MKDSTKKNCYGELPTVHVNAIYKGKRLYELASGKEVELEENSQVKLIIFHKDILAKDLKEFETEKRTVLQAGQKLSFNLPNTGLHFIVELQNDLIFAKKSNKLPKAENCKCAVIIGFDRQNGEIINDFKPIVVNSLNQAFFQISKIYTPKAASHTTNVYKSFWVEGQGFLERYRTPVDKSIPSITLT